MRTIRLFSHTFPVDKYLSRFQIDYIDSQLNLGDKIRITLMGETILYYFPIGKDKPTTQIWLVQAKGKVWLTYPKGHYMEIRPPIK